jgi:lambda repressor-like predicted transcriptional regulator
MKPLQRKLILIGKGITQRSIAKSESVTLSAVNNVLHDRTKSLRLCMAIAEKYMGLPVYIVWPAWFSKNECMNTSSNLANRPDCVNGKP